MINYQMRTEYFEWRDMSEIELHFSMSYPPYEVYDEIKVTR